MTPAHRSFGRRALFAVTDPRTMALALAGLAGLFVHGVATGSHVRVVYPWNAPRPQLAEAPADGSSDDSIESAPVVLQPEATAEAIQEEAERPSTVPRQPPPTPGSTTPSETPRSGVPGVRVAATPERTTERAGGGAGSQAGDSDPAVDLTPLLEDLRIAEAAIADEQWRTAADALRRVDDAAASARLSAELRPGEALSARIGAARDDVALFEFEENVLEAIRAARSAQESGDYPAAIGALEALVDRANTASGARSRRMIERLDFWQVTATARNLIEACEFERENLGRTAPC
jgi:hypothetical protein